MGIACTMSRILQRGCTGAVPPGRAPIWSTPGQGVVPGGDLIIDGDTDGITAVALLRSGDNFTEGIPVTITSTAPLTVTIPAGLPPGQYCLAVTPPDQVLGSEGGTCDPVIIYAAGTPAVPAEVGYYHFGAVTEPGWWAPWSNAPVIAPASIAAANALPVANGMPVGDPWPTGAYIVFGDAAEGTFDGTQWVPGRGP